MKLKYPVGIGILICSSFLLGARYCLWQSRLVEYRVGKHANAFYKDDPLSGIQSAQFVLELQLLRKGNTNRAIAVLESMLDFSVDEARQRRAFLKDAQLSYIDKTLTMVAAYRARYPRESATNVNDGMRMPESLDRAIKTNAMFQMSIDTFLNGFRSNKLDQLKGSVR